MARTASRVHSDTSFTVVCRTRGRPSCDVPSLTKKSGPLLSHFEASVPQIFTLAVMSGIFECEIDTRRFGRTNRIPTLSERSPLS